MSFPKAFIEDLKSRFRPSDIIGRTVKLKRHGREFKGLSPFTNEKTPSFTVNDEKGFYHCFSSGEHGDIFAFLMKTQRLTFYEAVKLLAEEAGVSLPRVTPAEIEREKRRSSLYDVMEFAADFYRQELRRRPGREALAYLNTRGLSSETVAEFGLGYAPGHRASLLDYLAQKQITPSLAAEAGLIIQPDDGGAPFDRFRNRVIFPISDGRGRTIAFGGRSLDPSQPAKYLNSPETPLFRKGTILYNFGQARDACFRSSNLAGDSVVVVEGYMDVIALFEVGLRAAVAPLGTALTSSQIELLWRLSPEPILCFDGDPAGLAAAYRAIDRALPLLKPGHSLRFAVLPDGQDPDDLVRSGGRARMDQVLDASRPLSDMVWQRELEQGPIDTPERRAGLENRLRTALEAIKEPRIQAYYRDDFRERIRRLFQPTETGTGIGNQIPGREVRPRSSKQSSSQKAQISPQLRRSALLSGVSSGFMRESLIVLTMLNHPDLLDHKCEVFAEINLDNPKLDRLRNEIIRVAATEGALDREELQNHLSRTDSGGYLADLRGETLLRHHPFAGPKADFVAAEKGWNHLILLHRRSNALQTELDEAELALATDTTEENLARLVAVKSELLSIEAEQFDLGESSTFHGPSATDE